MLNILLSIKMYFWLNSPRASVFLNSYIKVVQRLKQNFNLKKLNDV